MERYDLIYRGTPALASTLVDMLKDEGASAEWRPPMDAHELQLAVAGSEAAIHAAIARFRYRWPKAEIHWRQDGGFGDRGT